MYIKYPYSFCKFMKITVVKDTVVHCSNFLSEEVLQTMMDQLLNDLWVSGPAILLLWTCRFFAWERAGIHRYKEPFIFCCKINCIISMPIQVNDVRKKCHMFQPLMLNRTRVLKRIQICLGAFHFWNYYCLLWTTILLGKIQSYCLSTVPFIVLLMLKKHLILFLITVI